MDEVDVPPEKITLAHVFVGLIAAGALCFAGQYSGKLLIINFLGLWLIWTLAATVFTYDWQYQLIPRLIWPTILITAVFLLLRHYFSSDSIEIIKQIFLGGLVGSAIPALLAVSSKEKWMGYGDIEVGLLIGLILGLKLVLLGWFLSVFLGAVVGIIMKRFTRSSVIPFAPFLLSGCFIALISGQWILRFYLGLFK